MDEPGIYGFPFVLICSWISLASELSPQYLTSYIGVISSYLTYFSKAEYSIFFFTLYLANSPNNLSSNTTCVGSCPIKSEKEYLYHLSDSFTR